MSSVKMALRTSNRALANDDFDSWTPIVPPVQGAARGSTAGVILSIARLRDRRRAGHDAAGSFQVDDGTYGSGDPALAEDIADEIERTGW